MDINNSNINLKLLKLLILVSVLGSAIYYYALELETHPDDDLSSLVEVQFEENKESKATLFFPKSFGNTSIERFLQNTKGSINFLSSTSFDIQHKYVLPKYILFLRLRLDC